MNINTGIVFGFVFAVVGITAGLYSAWLGLSSSPYDSQQIGVFSSVIGAILGCTGAAIGVSQRTWSRRSLTH